MQVFPNPTSGVLTIQNGKQLKLNTAQVYSTAGQLIKSFNLNSNAKSSTIDLSGMVKGTYMIKLNTDTESTNVKIIKK